jgi:hypothetical protein
LQNGIGSQIEHSLQNNSGLLMQPYLLTEFVMVKAGRTQGKAVLFALFFDAGVLLLILIIILIMLLIVANRQKNLTILIQKLCRMSTKLRDYGAKARFYLSF